MTARARPVVVLVSLLLLVLHGCTYAKEEPGLFPRPDATEPERSPAREESRPPPQPTNPELPVAGEVVWTSGDGLELQTRVAVHAVRRISGATVLDWSVTPLRRRGLSLGDSVAVDLGLGRARGGVNVHLLDPETGKVYRPLSHRSARDFYHCLCTPLWAAQLTLRIGETRMLQVAYPELPASVRFVDVNLVTLAPFTHLPVTPISQVPRARQPTDLSRPADASSALMQPLEFRNRPGQDNRRQSIAATRIIAGASRTSVEWSLRSITDQPSFGLVPVGPPITGALPRGWNVLDVGSFSGPALRPVQAGAPVLRAQWVTDSLPGEERAECLCTNLALWAVSLRRAGGSAATATNYPALPPGTSQVDIVLPGIGEVKGLPVTRPADAAALTLPPVPADVKGWTYSIEDPPRGWLTDDWPTPVPASKELPSYIATTDAPLPVR